MNKIFRIQAIAAVVMLTVGASPAKSEPVEKTTFENLMSATVSNNYDAFVAECDDVMKAALTKTTLESVSKQIGPRAKLGYEARYLGQLKQRGYDVHLWCLSFKDGGDDVLATLSLKNGKVGGFYLH